MNRTDARRILATYDALDALPGSVRPAVVHACPNCGADLYACRDNGCADTNTEPPCIAGDHEPNDTGTACYYCGLPAEPVDPQELAEALYFALQLSQDRDRWSEALAGGDAARRTTNVGRPNSSYPADMPAQLAALARWHRADRIERDA